MVVTLPVFDTMVKVHPRVQKVRQLINRKDWKQAYKEAQFAYRLTPSRELRDIIEYAVWQWLLELIAKNSWEQAKSVAKTILELDIRSPEIRAEMPDIFARLDLNDKLPDELKKNVFTPEMQLAFIDQYLLYSQSASGLQSDYKQQADTVRQALDCIQNHNDEEALRLLQGIPFVSPLADWRMFARGLVEHYRENWEARNNAWKRLASERPAAKIAACLTTLRPDSAVTEMTNINSRENQIKSKSVKEQLTGFFSRFNPFRTNIVEQNNDSIIDGLRLQKDIEQIRDYMIEESDKEMLGRFNAVKVPLKNFDADIFARVQKTVWAYLTHRGDIDVLRQFVNTNKPLPLDPNGNRTYALAVELAECRNGGIPNWMQQADDYWLVFVQNDINQITSFSQPLKNRAKALVYDRIAAYYNNALGDFCEFGSAEHNQKLRAKCNKYLDLAIQSDPKYVDAYYHKIDVLNEADDESGESDRTAINAVLLEILKSVPDDATALEQLATNYLAANEPLQAIPFVGKLRELKPLDRDVLLLEKTLQTGLARYYLERRQLGEAREALDRADAISHSTLFHYFDIIPLALRFLFELLENKSKITAVPDENKTKPKKTTKAAQNDGSVGALYQQVFGNRYEKEFSVYFLILLEAAAIGLLDDPRIKSMDAVWDAQITGRCNGNAAGVIGGILAGTKPGKNRYPNRDEYLADAYDFITRATSVKWKTEKDLLCVCAALLQRRTKENFDALRKLGKVYLKQFPKSPFAYFFAAEGMKSNHFMFGRVTTNANKRELLTKAQELLAEHKNDSDYEFLVEAIPKRMAQLTDRFSPYSFDDDWNEDDDDDEWNDDWNNDDDDEGDTALEKLSGKIKTDSLLDMLTRFQPEMLEHFIPKELRKYREQIFMYALKEIAAHKHPESLEAKLTRLAEYARKGKSESEMVKLIDEILSK